MRIAASNIAWPAEFDDVAAAMLTSSGVTGLEIAPTRWWTDPSTVPLSEAAALGRSWADRGLPVVAAQSLLFGRPDLKVFGDAATRLRLLDYLSRVLGVARAAGATRFVFGSPKNRRLNGAYDADRRAVARDFFAALGDLAQQLESVVGIEANPAEYGADFLIRASDALEFVRTVGHPAIRLHLDLACMLLAGEDPFVIVPEACDVVVHAHASEPQLRPVGTGASNHAGFAAALARCGYRGWVSVEMLPPVPFSPEALAASLRVAVDAYSPSS
jgi:sugar phosphate isomerase/epimerase